MYPYSNKRENVVSINPRFAFHLGDSLSRSVQLTLNFCPNEERVVAWRFSSAHSCTLKKLFASFCNVINLDNTNTHKKLRLNFERCNSQSVMIRTVVCNIFCPELFPHKHNKVWLCDFESSCIWLFEKKGQNRAKRGKR